MRGVTHTHLLQFAGRYFPPKRRDSVTPEGHPRVRAPSKEGGSRRRNRPGSPRGRLRAHAGRLPLCPPFPGGGVELSRKGTQLIWAPSMRRRRSHVRKTGPCESPQHVITSNTSPMTPRRSKSTPHDPTRFAGIYVGRAPTKLGTERAGWGTGAAHERPPAPVTIFTNPKHFYGY